MANKELKFIPQEKSIIYGSHSIKVYSIGFLSYMCNRSQNCIRRWQRTKILPRPIFDLYDGKRWYTAAELIGYTQIVRQGNIRAGAKMPISVKLQFADFRRQLKHVIKKDPDNLQGLPSNFSIADLMRKHREDYWKEKANSLLGKLTQV